jgi:ABC-type multidrug transport system ATPase subunit
MLAPSGGDVLVWGHSVRSPSGLRAARAITGVCPQFDILWPEVRQRVEL